MKTKKIRRSPTTIGTEVGTLVGGTGFLFIGLLYGVVYGGSLGLMVAGMLFGIPIPPTIWARGLTLLGMVLGVVASAVVFIGTGAALGKGIGYLITRAWETTPVQQVPTRRKISLPALNEDNHYARKGRIAGAWVGGALFLSVGFWIGLVYGGEGGLLLAASFYGTPVPHIFLARAVVIMGMVFGVMSAATVCLVVGSVVGMLIGYVTSVVFAILQALVVVTEERRVES